MPGFDKSRIVGQTDEDLSDFTCAICLNIFINPKVTLCCNHTYCKACIKKWVSQNKTCPNDGKYLNMRSVGPVPRNMVNLLENKKIKCDYEMEGCSQVVKIGELSQHIKVCDYRPNQLCKECGLNREFVSTHNCIQSLIIEKEKTEVKYLKLVKENSQILTEKNGNQQIISTLRNDLADLMKNPQKIVDKIKSEHSTIVSELECELSDYKSKLILSEDNCRHLRVTNQVLTKELNSTVEKLRSEHSKIVEDLNSGYASAFNRERKSHQNELYKLKQTLKQRALLPENKPGTSSAPTEELNSFKTKIMSEYSRYTNQLKSSNVRELEDQRKKHQIEVASLKKRYVDAEESVTHLTMLLSNLKENSSPIEKMNCKELRELRELREELVTVKIANNFLKYITFIAIIVVIYFIVARR